MNLILVKKKLMTDEFVKRAADWDSPEKIRMTDAFVSEMLRHVTPQLTWKVLEIGAGTGLVGLQISRMVRQTVFEDTSSAMLDVLKLKLPGDSPSEILLGEVTDYKWQDIDLVFSCMAFHHIHDVEKTIKHLASITLPGSTVVVGDLMSEDGSFHRFGSIPHCGFDPEVLAGQFQQAGFKVIIVHSYHTITRKQMGRKAIEYGQFMLVARKN